MGGIGAEERGSGGMATLSQPVGLLMRPITMLAAGGSLEVAARRVRESGDGLVAVVQGDILAGAITERSLAEALAAGAEPEFSAELATVEVATIAPFAPGAEALRSFSEHGSSLIVIDEHRRVMGVISASDLFPRHRVPPRPALVGGMATPFGVYLTTGTVSAGAGPLALMATGGLMALMLMLASSISHIAAGMVFAAGASVSFTNGFESVLAILLFLIGMRLMPLSGYHAAEHQVVHAIEREEELVPSVVRRMPRVHPRCGTNLAVAISLFLGLLSWEFTQELPLRALVALVITAAFWRPLGSAIQLFGTTKPANDKQLAAGIRAGRELLQKYAHGRSARPRLITRIWHSGMFHVMAGSMATFAVIYAVSMALGLGEPF